MVNRWRIWVGSWAMRLNRERWKGLWVFSRYVEVGEVFYFCWVLVVLWMLIKQ